METRRKWNQKHKERLEQIDQSSPNERLKKLSLYLNGGRALDLACGLGGNSIFLANLGFCVHAIDLSDTAIQFLEEQRIGQKLSLHPIFADLTDWKSLNLKKNDFDLVVITYYLDRTLFPFVKELIKEKGYFFMETFFLSNEINQVQVSNQYKLKSQELLTEFKDWHILYFEENEQEGRQTLLCRK
jgi:2-polyprenyl-3-methyl-5-hydroxy-6-metoxy-1,4-benzoquinol methylase